MAENVFQKNIEALAQRDAKLAQKILTYVPESMPQLVQEKGFYNFVYKNKYLHNQENPLAEAKEIFSRAENTPVAIHMIYGMGLGYLFQVTSANSKGTVILYEPDLAILKAAFALVDFSGDILKENVYIADDIETAGEYIYRKSNMKNTPLLLSTISYREFDEQKFNELVIEMQKLVGSFGLDLKFTKEKFYPVLCDIINNTPKLINEIPLTEIRDFYKGKTAVVVSAGPTLDRNIETIKKYRDNIVLIVVGTAMRTISAHGLTPDFLCIIEAFDCSAQIKDLDLENINFVTEPFSNPNLKSFKFKHVFSHVSSNMPVNKFWCEIAGGLDNSEYLSKGSVSYTALNTARILGCSKIAFVGQDLAYIEGQCYSKDSAYKDLECVYNEETQKWEIGAKDFDSYANALTNYGDKEFKYEVAKKRLRDLNGSLYYVKGINGDMIPTESVYAAFLRPLKEFVQMYPDREYFNTSLVGAQIDGFENVPLEEVLKDTTPITEREFNISFSFDKELIKENLFKAKKTLTPITIIIDEIKKACKNLKNDINRYRTINQEVLKGLKKISTGYLALSSDYTKQSMIFDFISISERTDIDYEMKMTQSFSVESVNNITDKIAEFASVTESKINTVSAIIEHTIGELG